MEKHYVCLPCEEAFDHANEWEHHLAMEHDKGRAMFP